MDDVLIAYWLYYIIFISKYKNNIFRKFHFCWLDLSNSHTKQNYQFCKIFPCSSLCSQCCIKCISKIFSRKTEMNTLIFIIISKLSIITSGHLCFLLPDPSICLSQLLFLSWHFPMKLQLCIMISMIYPHWTTNINGNP